MSYPIKQLSQLCDIVMGHTPARKEPEYWGKGNKWVSISDLTSKVICNTKEEITDYAVTQTRCRKVPKGTLLFSFKLTIGKMAFAGCDLYTNEAIAALHIKNKKELYAEYLFFALQAAKLLGSNQAAMGKTLNSKSLAQIEIPVPEENGKPNLDDQKRIAHLLGKAEGLIAQRKQHLQQLDVLLKSVFLAMFGDPVRNEKEWDGYELGKVIKIKHGFAYKSEFFSDKGPFVLLTPGNFFEEGGFRGRGDRQKYYTGETPQEYILDKGDLLIAMTEQAPGLLGSPLIVPETNLFLHNQRLGLVVPKEPIQEWFLFHLFNQKSIRQIIHSKAIGTKVRHTSPTKLESIVVGYPPIELQNQFAAIVEKVEDLKSRYQQSLTDMETLYGALSQKAFKGELDLSRVPLPTVGPEIAVEEKFEAEEKQPEEPLFELPEPEELAVLLQSAEGRKTLLSQWLTSWLEQLGDAPFAAQHFMEATQQWLWKLTEDEAPDWGVAEYDELKAWVFDALEKGRLTQGYDDANNRVQVKTTKG